MSGKLLARYPLFRLLSPQQLDTWLAAGQEIDCPAGLVLFEENTPGAWVHLVRAGRVRVLRHSGRREVSLGVLLPSDVFGEYALLPPGNNTATCRTAAPSRLVRLPLAPLRSAVEGLPAVRRNLKNWLRLHTLLHFRREQTFLGFMSADSGLKLHDLLRPAAFPAGQTIQASGLADDAWYLIEQGTVRLEAGAVPGAAAADRGPGESFGEQALIGPGALPTAVAVSDVRCQVLARHDFDPSAPARSLAAQSYEPRLPARPKAHVWVPQLEQADCGLAALTMVGLRLGAPVSVEELRRKVTPGPEGVSLQRLRLLAEEVGLACQSARVSADRLELVSLPAIAHLNDGHYVVLHELGTSGAVVGDPATGIVTWNREHMTRRYSGALLVFDQTGGDTSLSRRESRMPESLTCRQGQRWQPPPEETVGRDTPSTGPVCGGDLSPAAGPVAAPADPWATVPVEPPSAPVAGPPASPPDPADTAKLNPAAPSPAAAATEPSAPTIVAGYEILGVLGRGAMGVVYKARQVSLNRLVALKMVLAGSHAGPQERSRFLAEAQAVAALQHPNIVQVYEVGEHDGLPFFSMELVEGGSLADRSRGTPVPAREAAALVEKLARAVQYAHQHGVVHRDLKPANILLGGEWRVASGEQNTDSSLATRHSPLATPKITDFGLAKRMQADPHATGARYATQTGTAIGTPSYMAPEQAAGEGKRVGPPADVYSLGAILYDLLTGRPPFVARTAMETLLLVTSEEPPPPSRLQPRLPRDLVTICLKCLRKEPEKRYATAGELADDLRRFLAGEPIRAAPVGRWERLVKWARRRPAAAALLAVSAVAALALLSGGIAYEVRLRQALTEAKAGRREAQARLVGLNVQAGMALVDGGQLPLALPLLVEALRVSTKLHEESPGSAEAAAEERMHRIRLAFVLRECPRLRRLWIHRGQIPDAAFSPDGRQVATAGGDGFAYVWDVRSGKAALPPLRHGGAVHQISFSPDGKHLLTACADGYANIWEVGRGREVCRSPKHGGEVYSAVFSADGQRFVTSSADGTARICHARTGKELAPVLKHLFAVRHAAFSRDGRRVVTVTAQAARLWDAASGKPAGPPLHQGRTVHTAAFSPRGDLLVTGGDDKRARIWRVANGRREGLALQHTLKHSGAVVAACFSPDGKYLATGSDDGTARLWLVGSGERLHRMQHQDRVDDVSFSPDGQFLVTGCDNNVAVVWDVASGMPWTHEMGAPNGVRRARFSPDGRWIVTASETKAVYLWQPVHAYRQQHPSPRVVRRFFSAKSKEGRWEAVSVDALTLRVRDGRTGKWVGPRLKPGGAVISAAFDPDGSRLLTATSAGHGRIWDPATGRALTPRLAHASAVLAGAFSPDGRLVATCSDDNTCRVWDAATGEPVTPYMKHSGTVYRAMFSPDGRCLLTACEGGTARLWDSSSGEPLSPPLDPEGWPKQVFASGGAAGSWKLPADDRPIDELLALAQWASGHHVDEKTGGLVPNLPEQLQSLKELIQTRYPRLLYQK
jgi:WD40 repeat protein/serine/threonine protein kinase/CRP-like cAMP-binding protein